MDEDRIAGSVQQAKGRAEAAAGHLSGDTKLQAEGWKDKTAGTLRNTMGSARDTAGGSADDPASEIAQLRAQVARLSAEPATPRLDAAARTADQYGEQFDRALDVVRQRPLVAVSTAVTIGFVLGRLVRGGTYVYRH